MPRATFRLGQRVWSGCGLRRQRRCNSASAGRYPCAHRKLQLVGCTMHSQRTTARRFHSCRVSSGYSNAQCQGNAIQPFSMVCSKRRPRSSDAHASFTGRERDAHAGTQADRLRRHARPIGRIACCSVARRSRLSLNSIATVADRCHSVVAQADGMSALHHAVVGGSAEVCGCAFLC